MLVLPRFAFPGRPEAGFASYHGENYSRSRRPVAPQPKLTPAGAAGFDRGGRRGARRNAEGIERGLGDDWGYGDGLMRLGRAAPESPPRSSAFLRVHRDEERP